MSRWNQDENGHNDDKTWCIASQVDDVRDELTLFNDNNNNNNNNNDDDDNYNNDSNVKDDNDSTDDNNNHEDVGDDV